MPRHATARSLKSELAGALKQRMASRGLDVSSFAKQMQTSRSAVRRLLDADNTAVTIHTLARAADVAGLEISLVVRQKTPTELTGLARRLARAQSPVEAALLKKKLTAGFYGRA